MATSWNDFVLSLESVSGTCLHRHHLHQLSIAIEGQLWVSVDAQSPPRAHQAVLIRADSVHSVRGAVLSLYADPESEVGRKLSALLGPRTLISIPSLLQEAFLKEIECTSSPVPGVNRVDVARDPAAVSEWVAHAWRRAGRPPTRPLDDRVLVVRERLRAHDGLRAPLADLAEGTRLSPSRVRHLFAEQVGIPIREYVVGLRVARSVAGIYRGEPIAQVAHDSGFADAAALCRAYRRTWGLTPSHLRRA